jgi:hypothetical protein
MRTKLNLLTSLFSASYMAFCMIFLSQARVRLLQTAVSATGQLPLTELGEEDVDLRTNTAEQYLSSAIQLAHRSAQILRDLRERYGLKITPIWLLQLQAVAAGVLVLDSELASPTIVTSPGAAERADTIDTSAAALEEVFRCLLGTGVEIILARAIARMTYQTAFKQKVVLSENTQSMLRIMSETAWRPSDARLISSTYPNFATTQGYDDSEERMSELLTKWEVLEL